MIHSTRPVFVDASGRRRRLVTTTGALVGAGLAAGIAVLVASVVVGAAPSPLPGLPAGGQGVQREHPAAEAPSSTPTSPVTPAPASTRPPTTTAPAPAGAAGPPDPAAEPTASSSTRGNRPTAHPGNPKPSRTR